MPHPYFFLNSLAWNFGLGMTWLPVPLYAHAQGLSSAEIGALFAFPILVQAPLNLLGGAYTDRAQGFWLLMLGQLVMILARASFWPATWSDNRLAAELGLFYATYAALNISGSSEWRSSRR